MRRRLSQPVEHRRKNFGEDGVNQGGGRMKPGGAPQKAKQKCPSFLMTQEKNIPRLEEE